MKLFLICYDIKEPKRLYLVAKTAYAFAMGGQKSALEALLSKSELSGLKKTLAGRIDHKSDKINIIPVEDDPLLFGKAEGLKFDNGAIIL